jgi:hypothetical protein
LPELLEAIVAGEALPGAIDDVVEVADPGKIPLLDRALRRLPLREDATWLDDHARLARLRARLACSDNLDCGG